MKKAVLHTDGGARGNPGPAGIGAVLVTEGEEKQTHSRYIGTATNNQAEYEALLAGLDMAAKARVTHMTCYLDSELIVKQLNGQYRVKNVDLKEYYDQVQKIAKHFTEISFHHVRREKNKEADRLVNEAISLHCPSSDRKNR